MVQGHSSVLLLDLSRQGGAGSVSARSGGRHSSETRAARAGGDCACAEVVDPIAVGVLPLVSNPGDGPGPGAPECSRSSFLCPFIEKVITSLKVFHTFLI